MEDLSKDTGDLRICPRLTAEHVMVTGAGRQKVKLAARLFSHNVSRKEATKFFDKARVIGKNTLQPFQKGILMNNRGLPLLLESLKQYGVKYIITRAINQDHLESFFGVIRSKGGLLDHPSPKEFLYRLRNCILG